jgi:nitrogen fixation/metabolism regulation signal transduction histidine kinase
VVRLGEIERAAENPELVHALERELTLIDQEASHNADRIRAERAQVSRVRSETLLALTAVALLLVVALGALGILATRQIVAPMIRLKRLLRKVTRGKLDIHERLHASDELSELFNVFMEMVDSLKRAQAREIGDLTVAIREAEASGASIEVLQRLRDLKDSMEVALQPPDATIRISAAAVRAMTDKIK